MTDAPTDFSGLMDYLGIEEAAPVSFGLPGSIALIGGQGTGKTTAAGSIVKVPEYKDAQIAYVDLENGSSAWATDPQIMSEVYNNNPKSEHYNPDGRIKSIPISRSDTVKAKQQIDRLLGYKDENGQKHIGALFSPTFGFDVIIIDTFDALQSVGYDFYMATTKTKDGRPDTLGAYGALGPWTTRVAWELQTNKPLGILLSHEMEQIDPKTGLNKLTMKLAGGAKDNVGSAPDIVARLYKQNFTEGEGDEAHIVTHFMADMTGDETALLKNRYGFEEPMIDFTLPKLYAAIKSKIDNSSAVIRKVKTADNKKKQEPTVKAAA